MTSFQEECDNNVFIMPDGQVIALVCCICDILANVDETMVWIDTTMLMKYCESSKLTTSLLENIYPVDLIKQYSTSCDPRLANLVLSPSTVLDKENGKVCICTKCYSHFQKQEKIQACRKYPPSGAIGLGYLFGKAPSVLVDLNDVEIALLSPVRVSCQSWIYFAGSHQHIQGYHTFYHNKAAETLGTMETMLSEQMNGNLLVVLCGPFTSTQKALVLKQTQVSVTKMRAAFEWLKENNYHYKNMTIPEHNELPIPVIYEENV